MPCPRRKTLPAAYPYRYAVFQPQARHASRHTDLTCQLSLPSFSCGSLSLIPTRNTSSPLPPDLDMANTASFANAAAACFEPCHYKRPSPPPPLPACFLPPSSLASLRSLITSFSLCFAHSVPFGLSRSSFRTTVLSFSAITSQPNGVGRFGCALVLLAACKPLATGESLCHLNAPCAASISSQSPSSRVYAEGPSPCACDHTPSHPATQDISCRLLLPRLTSTVAAPCSFTPARLRLLHVRATALAYPPREIRVLQSLRFNQ